MCGISSFALLAGFVIDTLTLRRVDMLLENVWVIGNLLLVAACIVLINWRESKAGGKNSAKIHFWLVTIMQFAFGGLLSAFVVFYFRSATLEVSWPFLLMLVAAFIGNEGFKKHYTRVVFQISFLYLCLFSFSIFLLPVVFRKIGTPIFLASGLTSLLLIYVFLKVLKRFTEEKFYQKSRFATLLSITVIFVIINGLYFFNFIPPLPLSLKDAGVYHTLARNDDGNYQVSSEDQGLFGFFRIYENIHIKKNDRLYAYSAVYLPTSLDTILVHKWQRYDEAEKKWVLENKISLPVAGGREGGYRTYSIKGNLKEGKWRVSVETYAGEVIGRMRFVVSFVDKEPPLETKINK